MRPRVKRLVVRRRFLVVLIRHRSWFGLLWVGQSDGPWSETIGFYQ
jgi:hypothetical protein